MLSVFEILFSVMLWGSKRCPFLCFEIFCSGRFEKSFVGGSRGLPEGVSGGFQDLGGSRGVWELLEEPGEGLGGSGRVLGRP